MGSIVYQRLKAYKQAESISKILSVQLKLLPKKDPFLFKKRLRENMNITKRLLIQSCKKCDKREVFVNYMSEVILANSELSYLIEELGRMSLLKEDCCIDLLEKIETLRAYELEIINNIPRYFEEGKALKEWYVEEGAYGEENL